MASDLAPVAYQQWDFQKAQTTHSSPSSDTSASEFFDAEDKLRITPNMDEIREALAVESKPVFNKEYLSSEEALSPVVDDGTSDEEEDEEESEAELEVAELVEVDLWEEIRVFALDIAITLSMQFVGPPKVVDMHMPYSMASHHVAPLRIDSLPPRTIPLRSPRRTQIRAAESTTLNSRFSGSSQDPLSPARVVPSPVADSPETLHSRFSGSSYADSPTTTVHSESTTDSDKEQDLASSAGSTKSSKRHASIFSLANNNMSATFPPPLSEQDAISPAPAFLTYDPFENAIPTKSTHSRLRSISSKFPKISFSKKDGQKIEETEKKERRNSYMRTSTPVSFFNSRDSRDYQDCSVMDHPSLSRQSSIISPVQTTPTQQTFSRMIPRGANERADPIRLPPCPDNYDISSPPELLQSQTFPVGVPRKPVAPSQFMKRRKSLLGLG